MSTLLSRETALTRTRIKEVKTGAEHHEQRCPACSRKFTVDSGTAKKKVRCPKCRAIVTLTGVSATNGGQGERPPQISAVSDDWKTRCAILEGRIEVLERQMELRANVAPPRSRSIPVPAGSPDSSIEDRAQFTPRPQPTPEALASRAAHRPSANPRSPPPHEVTVVVGAGDITGHRIAEALKDVVARAGWRIPAVIEKQIPPDCRQGLTLAADPTLTREQLAGLFKELRAAGFPVNLHLNPNLGPSESVLMVGNGTWENIAGV